MFSHKSTSPDTTTSNARFGDTYGYRFNGDSVELNATFDLTSASVQAHHWALQLRATPVNGARDQAGHLVAEAPLPPLEELGGTREPFQVSAPANLPAGAGEFQMSLVLVSKLEGQTDRIHDKAEFTRTERFFGPVLTSPVIQERRDQQIHVSLAAITNTRSAENLSGTLSVELWALPAPYAGGVFEGVPLAGVVLGQLQGQQTWSQPSFDLTFTPPPAGVWHLALMLREWNGTGYTTRDFHNFERPLLVEPNNPPVKVAEVPLPAAPAAKTVVIKAADARQKPAAPSKPSVNKASAAELAKIKGLTKATAAAIVAARPISSLDQLAKIKGIGQKTLEKLRGSLSL